MNGIQINRVIDKHRNVIPFLITGLIAYAIAKFLIPNNQIDDNFEFNFLILLVLVMILWLSIHVRIALCLLIFLAPLQRGIFGDIGFYISFVPVAAILIAITIYMLKSYRGSFDLNQYAPELMVVGLLLFSFISLIIAGLNVEGSVTSWLPWEIYGNAPGEPRFRFFLQCLVIFAGISVFVHDGHRLRMILRVIATTFGCVILVSSCWLFCNALRNGFSSLITSQFGSIFQGWTGNAQLANFVIMNGLILLPYGYANTADLRHKAMIIILALVCAMIMITTHSLGNYAAGIIGITVLYFLSSSRTIWPKLLTVTLVMVFLIVSVELIGVVCQRNDIYDVDLINKTRDIMSYLRSGCLPYAASRSLWARLDLIGIGWDIFTKHFIAGVGIGCWGIFSNPYFNFPTYLFRETLLISNFPHNSYIQILAEMGSIGALWFVVFIALIGRRLLKTVNKAKVDGNHAMHTLTVGIIAALAANLAFLFDYAVWRINIYFWLNLGLAVAVSRVYKKKGIRSVSCL
jgi:O-antigen ligase